MTRWLLSGCAVIALAVPARAAEIDALARRVAKYATEYVGGQPGKYPCVCQDGSELHGTAGFSHRANLAVGEFRKVSTFCLIYGFGPSGESTSADTCPVFVTLAK